MATVRQLPKHGTSISEATIIKLIGLASITVSAIMLSYVAWAAVQALQSPSAAITAEATLPTPAAVPVLQLNLPHQRQGAIVTPPTPSSGRNDPFIP